MVALSICIIKGILPKTFSQLYVFRPALEPIPDQLAILEPPCGHIGVCRWRGVVGDAAMQLCRYSFSKDVLGKNERQKGISIVV